MNRDKQQRRLLANRFKDSKDPFPLVIVHDMWLTGFDVPCLHTMYADKPIKGHESILFEVADSAMANK